MVLNPPDPNDYPYSGWVGLGVDLIRQTADRRAIFETNLGWIGPYSGAEDLQDSFHSLDGSHQFQGWDAQLKNEPVLQFAYRQDWRLAALSNLNAATPGSFGYDFITHAMATAGNGWDYAAAGFVARWGYQLPMDFGPARMRLGDIASAPYAAPGAGKNFAGDWSLDAFSAYVCLGAEGRAVARDITLDGNTLANSASVVHKPLVGEVYTGLVTQYKNFRGSFLVIYESDTFDSQPQPGQWRGALTLGWQF
jgi:lipid A 3-O-deacylase